MANVSSAALRAGQPINPYAEMLRKEEQKRMQQQAQEAGIPYSPEYLAALRQKQMGPPSPQDTLKAQENMAFTPPIAPPTMPNPPASAAPGGQPPVSAPVASNPPPPQQPPPGPQEPPPQPSIFDNPEATSAVLGMGANNRAIEQAMKLRNTPNAEGRYHRGNIYTAASPLEHLSVGLLRMKGKKDLTKAEEKQLEAKKSIIDALRTRNEPKPIATSTETDFYEGMLS